MWASAPAKSRAVPTVRPTSGELYGFDRLTQLTLSAVREIATTAQQFGPEVDITALSLTLAR